MNIEIQDVLTLSDSCTYVVCSKTEYQKINYYYLMDIEKNENIKFVQEKFNGDKKTVAEVEDKELLQVLLPLFFENAKHLINQEYLEQSE